MMARRFGVIGLCVFLALLQDAARAQRPQTIPLIPAANWKLSGTKILKLEALRQWGGNPVIDREYGIEKVELRTYVLRDQSVEVLIEQTPDPSAAYGVFTYYGSASHAPARGMQLALIGPSQALMARGRYFVRIALPPDASISESDLHALMILIGGTGPSRRELASLPGPLPASGLVKGSEKYLIGNETARRVLPSFRTDLLGFSQGGEVHLASYQLGQHRATLMAVSYPTPQIARVRYGAMESFLGFNQERGTDSVFARRSGSYVFIVLGSPSRTAAIRLMDQLKVKGEVSWDEPPPRSKPFIVEVIDLIFAILLLALILAGLGVVGGIAVFGWKRAMAKWFPEVEWANPDRESIIKLNLS